MDALDTQLVDSGDSLCGTSCSWII